MIVRDEFHKIIDSIEDENTLKGYYDLISRLSKVETGSLYNSLTPVQKNELDLSIQESKTESNLLSHSEVKDSHSKWL